MRFGDFESIGRRKGESMVWLAYSVREQIRITDMYSLFEAHFDNGYAFPGESHNFWECLYVMKGEVCASGNERVYNLTRGSIIFHKPLELHKFIVNGPDGADLLIFSFAAEGPLTSCLAEKVFALSDAQQDILASMLSFIRAKMEEPRFRKILSARDASSCLEPFLISSTYSQMLVTYLHQLMLSLAETGSVSSVSSAPDAVIFRRAISYLNSNVSAQPSVPEIARYCNVSEASIKRIFDKYAGMGIHKYLLKLKVKAAAELLQSGESVSSVAEQLGFNNQSYFSRAFKRETGLAPSNLKAAASQ
nr:AraC family transcriptional regulator [uncultured Acetatifactor sp.]